MKKLIGLLSAVALFFFTLSSAQAHEGWTKNDIPGNFTSCGDCHKGKQIGTKGKQNLAMVFDLTDGVIKGISFKWDAFYIRFTG